MWVFSFCTWIVSHCSTSPEWQMASIYCMGHCTTQGGSWLNRSEPFFFIAESTLPGFLPPDIGDCSRGSLTEDQIQTITVDDIIDFTSNVKQFWTSQGQNNRWDGHTWWLTFIWVIIRSALYILLHFLRYYSGRNLFHLGSWLFHIQQSQLPNSVNSKILDLYIQISEVTSTW